MSGDKRIVFCKEEDPDPEKLDDRLWLVEENKDLSLINLAFKKPATQSSTEFEAKAVRAVDGNTDGNFGKGSVTHTSGENRPWWQVDLQSIHSISSVEVYNRTDCCGDRLKSFNVKLSTDGKTWTDFYFASQAGSPTTIQCNNVKARYVRIQLTGTNPLSLAEVRVYGK